MTPSPQIAKIVARALPAGPTPTATSPGTGARFAGLAGRLQAPRACIPSDDRVDVGSRDRRVFGTYQYAARM